LTALALRGLMRMTGSDLIVLAPWIVFGVVLAVIGILLLRSRHRKRNVPEKNGH
jgi:predicted tellurium resistance membrane protein TerC